jgi:YVTN family beta-propeller protein
MTARRLLAVVLVVLLVVPGAADAARKKKKCRRLCKDTIAACVAANGCADLAKRRDRKRCKRSCKKNTLAQCKLDNDRTRCVPPTTTTTTTTLPAGPLVGPTHSSPIALAANDAFLVNVNPEADTISVFSVLPEPTKLAEVTVGGDPSSVAIHPDSVTAYVANARDGTVSVVDLQSRTTEASIDVGAEPSGVAISPNGTRLFVANSASNTLQVIDTASRSVLDTIDLPQFGSAPRAVAVTNDGDDDDQDETIFVALFFGQLRAGKTAVQEGQDDQREGRILAISAATNDLLATDNPISLGSIANTGFNSNGRLAPGPGTIPSVASTNPQTFTTPTGAFPNQLADIALHPSEARGYVVSTGASPNGPLRFNSMAQGLVSVFDSATRLEVTAAQTDATVRRTAPLNLNQGINLATTPAPRLFLTNPVAMAWRPDGSDAWVVIQNTDLLVRLTADGDGVPTVDNPLVAGPSTLVRVDLSDVGAGDIAGKAPRGLAINGNGTRAYVFNFVSRSITTVDISNATAPEIVATARASDLPPSGSLDEIALAGAELFYTGRGPDERMSSEGWGGCIVCHPSGRSDNVTWMFDAGPRQTIPLDGMFSRTNPADQRVLNWSAVRDENQDFELNTRGVFGGRGLIDDDRLFLAIGGASGATPTDSGLVEQFQQFTGAVGTTNDLAGGLALPSLSGFSPRRDFAVAALDDGRVFMIGGRSGSGSGNLVGASDAVLEFNPRTNTLTQKSSAGFTIRHSLGAAAVKTSQGPRIYAIGGYVSTSPATTPANDVEEYNPTTNTWRTVATLPTAVGQFGITVAGGVNTAEPLELIHVVSGNTGTENTPSVVNANPVQRFQADPAGTGTWTGFNPTGLTLRRNLGAATVFRGVASRVMVIGGEDGSGVLDTVEEYTNAAVVAMVLTPHTALPAPRARFGIGSSRSTNQVYVIGGVDDLGADQSTVLELTVANNGAVPGPAGTPSGTWVTRGNLSAARRGLASVTPPSVTNFLPVQSSGRDARQDAIATWIATKIRAARAPVAATDPAVVSGRTLFGVTGLVQPGFSCATCHGGTKWTRSFVDYTAPPSPALGLGLGSERVVGAELRETATQPNVLFDVGTFTLTARENEIRFNGADISQAINPLGGNGFNIPSLLSVHETAPYFYSGLAQTLAQVLDGSQDGAGGTRHHFVSGASQRADLEAFLRSIDDGTPIFP